MDLPEVSLITPGLSPTIFDKPVVLPIPSCSISNHQHCMVKIRWTAVGFIIDLIATDVLEAIMTSINSHSNRTLSSIDEWFFSLHDLKKTYNCSNSILQIRLTSWADLNNSSIFGSNISRAEFASWLVAPVGITFLSIQSSLTVDVHEGFFWITPITSTLPVITIQSLLLWQWDQFSSLTIMLSWRKSWWF